MSGRLRLDALQEPTDPKAWLALALYREAVYVNSDAYKFLGFFKVINVIAPNGPKQIDWIREALPLIRDHEALERLSQLKGTESDIPTYLYGSGRCAVAHAYSDPLVNPDEPADLLRLRRDLPVARALAELAIERDFGVKSELTIYREHLYELTGFRDLFGPHLVAKLKQGGILLPTEIPVLPKLRLGFRDQPPLPAFDGLTVTAVAQLDGAVVLRLQSADHVVAAEVVLDFPNETLGVDFVSGLRVEDDGSERAARCALDVVRALQHCVRNQQFAVWNAESGAMLGRTDGIIPENINPGETDSALKAEAADLELLIQRRREKKASGPS